MKFSDCVICGRKLPTYKIKYCDNCAGIAECEKGKRRSIRYREEHRELLRKGAVMWRRNNIEKSREHSRNWVARNKDTIVIKNRQYRLDNPVWWKKQQEKQKQKRRYRRYRNAFYEVTVAVKCVICDEITACDSKGKLYCDECNKLVNHSVPNNIRYAINVHPSFKQMPDNLLRWKRVMEYRG